MSMSLDTGQENQQNPPNNYSTTGRLLIYCFELFTTDKRKNNIEHDSLTSTHVKGNMSMSPNSPNQRPLTNITSCTRLLDQDMLEEEYDAPSWVLHPTVVAEN